MSRYNSPETMSDRLKKTLTCDDEEKNKPDFRELILDSPIRPRNGAVPTPAATSSSSSSSSSGSLSGRTQTGPNPNLPKNPDSKPKSHSGELPVDSSPSSNRNLKPGHVRSRSIGSHPLTYSPAGNICPSGRVLKTGFAKTTAKTEVLRSGPVNYGHGSIIRAGNGPKPGSDPNLKLGTDPEELKRLGNESYKKGQFSEALRFYDKAIFVLPSNATYHFNRAAALMGLRRFYEAVIECEEAIKLDPAYVKAHHRLGSLFISLGQVDNAKKHICFPGHQPDSMDLQKVQFVEKHLTKCNDSRRVGDWKSTLREVDAAIASGADASPQLFSCRAEALLKLHQLDDASIALSNVPKYELASNIPHSQSKIFGMYSEAYLYLVRTKIELAKGRFDSALSSIEQAALIDPQNVEISILLSDVRLVGRARARGNDLFKSERFTEACSAYGEGLKLDPSNPVLYCNRAAAWFKIGQWERSVEDCDKALRIQPNYIKALLRRAASYSKLERWIEAVRDYEVVRRELPDDKEVAESLFHAQVALKKSRGEEIHNIKFGGEVELIANLEQFRAAISWQGTSVVHFKSGSNVLCKQISPFLDTLCSRYPFVSFLKVDVEESPSIAQAESVKIVPTFKIYQNGSRVKEMVCPSAEALECSIRHYST